MKINVFTMMIVINLVAALSVILSIVLLFFPFGRNLPGSGENASAITSSIAIIVATLGLVIATYMQSAEYRRESEVVDGIQGLRLLLELMIAEISVIEYHKVKKDERPRRAFELEQESLLKTLQGSAGRFLFLLRRRPQSKRNRTASTGEMETASHSYCNDPFICGYYKM